jgi:hypothetical protein
MFRANKKHRQVNLFGFQNSIPEKLYTELQNSEEKCFYDLIFCNIKEEDFSVLYSDVASRPNAPVNCLVSSFVLKFKNNWSYAELLKRMKFDILTKTALGLDTFSEIPFDETTIFNFQNRLAGYSSQTGINLFERVFDNLTVDQIKQLKLKTNIQRTDSVMADSNIRTYSRLQLLVEVLLRFWRILSDEDKSYCSERLSEYLKFKTSGQYIYALHHADFVKEIEKIAEIYHFLKVNILSKYQDTEFSKVFERVYTEHFTSLESKILVKPNSELNSDCMQSPDDLDATYRKKRNVAHRGHVINAFETASPDNEINLIDDISVHPNNTDDSVILAERIDRVVEKTPELDELHTDGGYGSSTNDEKFETLEITHYQTAIRGRQSEVQFAIEKISEERYIVKCPNQAVESEKAGERYKCLFDKSICINCPYFNDCPALERKKNQVYYFTHDDHLKNKRINLTLKMPKEKRTIRSNVEATIKEFSCRFKNKKMRVRGTFKTEVFAYAVGIGINLGRIYRYLSIKTA